METEMARVVLITAMMLGAMNANAAADPAAAPSSLHCVNPLSGAEWDLAVDLSNKLIDQKPAVITATEITWHDTDAGPNYDFDRSSGVMTKTVASSTGGYVITDKCELR